MELCRIFLLLATDKCSKRHVHAIMRDEVIVPVIAGLASGFLLILAFSTFINGALNYKPQDSAIAWYVAGNEIACGQSIENVRSRAPFSVPLPTVLPTGYSL